MSTQIKNQKRRQRSVRKAATIAKINGQGDYYATQILPRLQKLFPPGTFAKAGGMAGGALGGIGGNLINPVAGVAGGKLGSAAGSVLGDKLAKLVGFGDYSVMSNSLVKSGGVIAPGEAIPSFGVLGASTRVKHREYLGDVIVPSSPTAFTLASYAVNPGNNYAFPWLATIAGQYQQYRFDGLVFEFKTLSSDITSGGALGAVIMSSNYDVVQPSFSSKIQMENSQYAVSTKPSCSMIHTMECAPGQVANNLYYVRGSSPQTVSGQDNRFYDLANFQLATQGLPGSAGQVLGELWVSYDVQLFKPIVNEGYIGANITGASPTNAAIYGAVPTVTGSDATATGSTLTFTNPGDYLVTWIMTGTTFVAPTYTGTRNASTQEASLFGATSAALVVAVHTTVPGQTLITDFTGSASVATTQCFVSRWSYALH